LPTKAYNSIKEVKIAHKRKTTEECKEINGNGHIRFSSNAIPFHGIFYQIRKKYLQRRQTHIDVHTL
jgi:hypothetical protein